MSHFLHNLWHLISMTASHLFSGGWQWLDSTILTITPLYWLTCVAIFFMLGMGTCWACYGWRSRLNLTLTQIMKRVWMYWQQGQTERLHTEELLAEVQAIYDNLDRRAEAIEDNARQQAAREGLEEMRRLMFGE